MNMNNEKIKNFILSLRMEMDKKLGAYEEGTLLNYGSAFYPRFYKEEDGVLPAGLIADGEPQGFCFFKDGILIRTEESMDGDVFGGCKSTEECLQLIKDICLSEKNLREAQENILGQGLQVAIGKAIAACEFQK
jgi:hypothetical protein